MSAVAILETVARPDRYARTTFDAYQVSEPVKPQWDKTAPLQRTYPLGEVEAGTVEEAVAAALEAFCFCHKQQLIIRETGLRGILMHIYQIVKKPDTWVYDANHIARREQRLGVKFLCVIDGAVFHRETASANNRAVSL